MIFLLKAFEIACKRFQNLRLILTGKPQFQSDFDILNEYLTLNDKISYLGFLDTDSYYRTLNTADIFCMTRNNSAFANAGFPFKLGEFLASGKAVIATNVGDVGSYLKNKENALLIMPESVDEIVSAIEFFIENPLVTKVMGENARLTAEKYFDSNKLSKQVLSIFESI